MKIMGETKHERDVVRRFHLEHMRDARRYRYLRDHGLLSEWAYNAPGETDAEAIDAAIDEDMANP